VKCTAGDVCRVARPLGDNKDCIIVYRDDLARVGRLPACLYTQTLTRLHPPLVPRTTSQALPIIIHPACAARPIAHPPHTVSVTLRHRVRLTHHYIFSDYTCLICGVCFYVCKMKSPELKVRIRIQTADDPTTAGISLAASKSTHISTHKPPNTICTALRCT
jgi:hypothetical protein